MERIPQPTPRSIALKEKNSKIVLVQSSDPTVKSIYSLRDLNSLSWEGSLYSYDEPKTIFEFFGFIAIDLRVGVGIRSVCQNIGKFLFILIGTILSKNILLKH